MRAAQRLGGRPSWLRGHSEQHQERSAGQRNSEKKTGPETRRIHDAAVGYRRDAGHRHRQVQSGEVPGTLCMGGTETM